jgi:hypothetical protein
LNITNSQQYWQVIEDNWDDLLNIVSMYIDVNHPAYEIPGKCESRLTGNNCLQEMIFLKKYHDRRLIRYFFAAWNLAPDSRGIHNIPKWNILCDLLSEEWVLDEDEVI